jgi:hypothetical protein
MDKPRHPKGFGPGKPSKHKKINGARPRQNHGESAPGNFSALSAADRRCGFPEIETQRLALRRIRPESCAFPDTHAKCR